ncbi:hypothetical protein [Nostoc piscinale]|nr:hypothetical protein [Nostoc piscinale]
MVIKTADRWQFELIQIMHLATEVAATQTKPTCAGSKPLILY